MQSLLKLLIISGMSWFHLYSIGQSKPYGQAWGHQGGEYNSFMGKDLTRNGLETQKERTKEKDKAKFLNK